ncbi:MAG TPA: cytochrome P450 [Burkholderiaceae bacterium]|nr:cytochrome P450 [Burkholderiaceae bacterium]
MTTDAVSNPGVAQGFNLVMQLKDPRQLPELMSRLAAKPTRDRLDTALRALGYVHYSRFLPLWDVGRLMIVTEFDGGRMKNYVMDFAAVLDAEFTLILSYMKDAPPLPVSAYPDDFWDYVERNTQPLPVYPPYRQPFSSYPEKTVQDIIGLDDVKVPLAALHPADADLPRRHKVEMHDVQANVLRGYGGNVAIHAFVRFADDHDEARALIQALLTGELRVTSAEPWGPRKPELCVTLGFTHEGLCRLGLPPWFARRFPAAFREGAARREPALMGISADAPDAARITDGWRVGLEPVDAMVSIYSLQQERLRAAEHDLLGLLDHHKATLMGEMLRLAALEDEKAGMRRVHFGYRDSITQPGIEGVPTRTSMSNRQPRSPVGDFLLGGGHINARGGNFIGGLPHEMADNGTYAALRVIEQNERAFRELTGGREGIAAKLMGRWFDGQPLIRERVHGRPPAALDDFLYAEGESADRHGLRCPLGAHIRRMNPRDAQVMGLAELRRVIRRGMPYGPAYDQDPSAKRGLAGLFLCGDLESQYEFLLSVWGRGDLSTTGLRGTSDPFIGAHRPGNVFRYVDEDGNSCELQINKPLTYTRGALYLFLPGMSALRWLAEAGWERKSPAHASHHAATTRRKSPIDPDCFSPLDPAFRLDPYRFYAAFLDADRPIAKIPTHQAWWVFSHELVSRLSAGTDVAIKPDRHHRIASKARSAFDVADNFDDGLFYMDQARNQEVRSELDPRFAATIAHAEVLAEEFAQRLLVGPLRQGRIDVVVDYARPLTTRVFMKLMGIPDAHAEMVDAWVRSAMSGHDKGAEPRVRLEGASATMALRSYFQALGLVCPNGSPAYEPVTPLGTPSLMHGLQEMVDARCPFPGRFKSRDEAMQTALHLALGGYLSTEFLIGTGALNLLRHPQQMRELRSEPSLWPGAIDEMLRYDAPFQMADRIAIASYSHANAGEIQAGDAVVLVYGAANRDPVAFGPDAGEFDITREARGVRHFGFGPASRYCIGSKLAEQVATVALRELIRHVPDKPTYQQGEWLADPYYRSLKGLLLVLG